MDALILNKLKNYNIIAKNVDWRNFKYKYSMILTIAFSYQCRI